MNLSILEIIYANYEKKLKTDGQFTKLKKNKIKDQAEREKC